MAFFDKTQVGNRIVELEKALNKNSRQFALEAKLDVSFLAKNTGKYCLTTSEVREKENPPQCYRQREGLNNYSLRM